MEQDLKHRILILGASGFLGGAIYKELCSYFKTFGTYNTDNTALEKNNHFFQFNFEEDTISEILEITKPTIIISALRGDFTKQILLHQRLSEYILLSGAKLLFLSSANVFDAYTQDPSYELDKTYSNSIYGQFKIKVENMLLRLPKKQVAILRLPMVFGSKSPRILEIIQNINENEPVEIFPNLVINVLNDKTLVQQIHYIINRNKLGIFHLGSSDLVHHDDFIKDITSILKPDKDLAFKSVYTTNEDRFLAVLPKYNVLPKHLQIVSQDVLNELKL